MIAEVGNPSVTPRRDGAGLLRSLDSIVGVSMASTVARAFTGYGEEQNAIVVIFTVILELGS